MEASEIGRKLTNWFVYFPELNQVVRSSRDAAIIAERRDSAVVKI